MKTFAFAVHLDTGDGPRCGQRRAAYLSTEENAVTCGPCLELTAGTYRLGSRWTDTRPHGTTAAYRRHYRHGGKPCEACRQAEARYQAGKRDRLARAS